jgi:hypothetical protein
MLFARPLLLTRARASEDHVACPHLHDAVRTTQGKSPPALLLRPAPAGHGFRVAPGRRTGLAHAAKATTTEAKPVSRALPEEKRKNGAARGMFRVAVPVPNAVLPPPEAGPLLPRVPFNARSVDDGPSKSRWSFFNHPSRLASLIRHGVASRYLAPHTNASVHKSVGRWPAAIRSASAELSRPGTSPPPCRNGRMLGEISCLAAGGQRSSFCRNGRPRGRGRRARASVVGGMAAIRRSILR